MQFLFVENKISDYENCVCSETAIRLIAGLNLTKTCKIALIGLGVLPFPRVYVQTFGN